MPKKLTTEEFIEKARSVHKDKYDYSKVDYVRADKKVVIICPMHGEFEQKPANHLTGNGCGKCAVEEVHKSQRKTTEEFIREARDRHGDRYDYHKVKYLGANTYTVIICSEHGEFKQTPHQHLGGHGCPKCANMKRGRTLSHEEHVAAITKVNPDVEILERITGVTTPVLCRGRICGHEWRTTPHSLKRGHGCPKYAGVERKTLEEFILEAKAIHGDKYDYSLVEYVDSFKKVSILCPEHGKFKQTPHHHLNGHGCPKCASYGFLAHSRGSLYIMVDDLEVPTVMKIGVSTRVNERRGEILKSAYKAGVRLPDLRVVKEWEGPTETLRKIEGDLHKAFGEYRVDFSARKFNGSAEFFYYRPEVFALVEEYLNEQKEGV